MAVSAIDAARHLTRQILRCCLCSDIETLPQNSAKFWPKAGLISPSKATCGLFSLTNQQYIAYANH
jgi:hypothetical protein